jgi:hypothetical protein
MSEVLKYRKETEAAREAFLEHLSVLQLKYGALKDDADYSGAIEKIVTTEIVPEARKFKNQIDTAYEKMFGKAITSVTTFPGGGGTALQILGDLSWHNILGLAGVAGAAVFKAAIEAEIEARSARRECAISYLLGLD